QYCFLGLKDIDLGYAGSFTAQAPIHRSLAELSTGSAVTVKHQNKAIVITTNDTIIAVLSKQAQLQWQNKIDSIQSARIIAMVIRYQTDSDAEYQSRYKVEQWEVPVIEIEYQTREQNNTPAHNQYGSIGEV
ncbi:MAG: hypothetical protein K0U68_00560, partial [Gammaproteobacteria bacterium]|nr:hypothetical protein [Gammaproteobacteria bacterium]